MLSITRLPNSIFEIQTGRSHMKLSNLNFLNHTNYLERHSIQGVITLVVTVILLLIVWYFAPLVSFLFVPNLLY